MAKRMSETEREMVWASLLDKRKQDIMPKINAFMKEVLEVFPNAYLQLNEFGKKKRTKRS